jgi:hypothetical protein
MRYIYKPKEKLRENCVRVYSRFLWLPLTIANETRWLETAMVQEETRFITKSPSFARYSYRIIKWVPVAFVSFFEEIRGS